MSVKVLVVAAHADDEALGCGGTIARHVADGDTVSAIFMADGVSARPDAMPDDLDKRIDAARRAHQILGLESVKYLNLPDNRMDSLPFLDVVQDLEDASHAIDPEVIYTHHCGDLNIDHRTTQQAVLTAFRPTPGSSVREIYGFEVLSSTDWSASSAEPFLPSVYVDIGDFLEVKLKALKAYEHEMRPTPHSRSIENAEYLARYRGHSMGIKAAEAFMALRLIR